MASAALSGLTPKQEEAIVALLNQPTVRAACEAIGVGERTIHRWLDDPAFAEAYRRARRETFRQAIGLTHKYAALAVQTLAKVMADPKAPHGAKVSAAARLLEFSREALELDDLAARVDALETRAKTIIDTTASEISEVEVPPEALPGGAWITEDGVQPDFKADAAAFKTRPEGSA